MKMVYRHGSESSHVVFVFGRHSVSRTYLGKLMVEY